MALELIDFIAQYQSLPLIVDAFAKPASQSSAVVMLLCLVAVCVAVCGGGAIVSCFDKAGYVWERGVCVSYFDMLPMLFCICLKL